MYTFTLCPHPHAVELCLKRLLTIDAGTVYHNNHLEIVIFSKYVPGSEPNTLVPKIYIKLYQNQKALSNLVDLIIPVLQLDVARKLYPRLFQTIPLNRPALESHLRLHPIREDITQQYPFPGYKPRCYNFVSKLQNYIIYILPLELNALHWLARTARAQLEEYYSEADIWDIDTS